MKKQYQQYLNNTLNSYLNNTLDSSVISNSGWLSGATLGSGTAFSYVTPSPQQAPFNFFRINEEVPYNPNQNFNPIDYLRIKVAKWLNNK